jgi:hypothetical protein
MAAVPESRRGESSPAMLLAGGWAIAASVALMIIAAARDKLNPLSGITIALGIIGGGTLLVARRRWGMISGALPALFGGLGLLFVPPIVIAIAWSLRTAGEER